MGPHRGKEAPRLDVDYICPYLPGKEICAHHCRVIDGGKTCVRLRKGTALVPDRETPRKDLLESIFRGIIIHPVESIAVEANDTGG